MYRTACRTLLVFLAGVTIINSTPISTLDLLRLLNDKAWMAHHRAVFEKYSRPGDISENKRDQEYTNVGDNSVESSKRSAVATALNTSRRRRQPSPSFGKAVTPYVGVGILGGIDIFFDDLENNLELLATLSPSERNTFLRYIPTVIQAQTADMSSGGGSGIGIRKLNALRPLRPASNIKSYNRRSFIEPDGGYPGANHHDPGLLWTGLGRR